MIAVEIKGQSALELKLNGLTDSIAIRDVLDQSAAILLSHILQRFNQGVDTDGTPWAALNPKYAKQKEKKWGTVGILFASGALRHSIQIFPVDDESRAIGTDIPYAPFHQYGTIKMPKREFFGISDEDSVSIETGTMDIINRILSNE